MAGSARPFVSAADYTDLKLFPENIIICLIFAHKMDKLVLESKTNPEQPARNCCFSNFRKFAEFLVSVIGHGENSGLNNAVVPLNIKNL